MIQVLIAEDQSMVAGALAALLELEDDIQVIGQAPDGAIALDMVRENQPQILVSDIEMPHMTGLDLAAGIKEEQLKTKVLILTTFARPGYLRRALNAGVKGYLLKDAPAEQLAAAIRKVASGGRAIDPELALDAWETDNPLTEREREVLKLAGEGLTAKAISNQLHLAHGTVRNYLSEAIRKMDADNRVEAANLAKRNGWL